MRPASLKPFVREMLNLQIFRQFIEERLTMLNNGLGFSDEFEVETFKLSEKSSSKLKQQYKEWTTVMKSEGKEFFKTVKDKANPAVKSAVRTVKGGGKGVKNAYKGLRFRLKEGEPVPHNLSSSTGDEMTSTKPRSAPSSPTSSKRRLAALSVPTTTYRKETSIPFKSSPFERSYSPLSPSSQPQSPEEGQSRSESPDLIREVQDLLNFRLELSPGDRSLKPNRSLDNFKQISPPFPSNSRNRGGGSGNSYPIRGGPVCALPNLICTDSENRNIKSAEDIFSPLSFLPPPRAPPPPIRDLFDTSAFVIGDGSNENGDPLFYVTNQHSVDIVKLSPPVNSAIRKHKKNDEAEDLIRLDSTSDEMDDFDPLKSPQQSPNTSFLHRHTYKIPPSISNPLYSYNSPLKTNGNIQCSTTSREDQNLLREYGLDLRSFSNVQNTIMGFDTSASSSSVNSQSHWTTFD
ncbi:hypothetical protein WA026_020119 [Henosepilachna vigintioctopunctata]|uniref:DENN domain-containing protein 1A n=1 Tax=Henosepilachna vigintioctopunctata TaxID=420089 RepID=A0AAW1UBB0_9CUCU